MNAAVAHVDVLAVVKMLASGRPLDFVRAANPHLTDEQVRVIATSHGYPDKAKLAWAVDVLAKQAAESDSASIPEPTTIDRAATRWPPVSPPPTPPTRPAGHRRPVEQETPVTADLRRPDGTEPSVQDLVAKARQSGKATTRRLAEKVVDQVRDLRRRLAEEQREQQVLDEVRRAEEALKAAREKAARLKGHSGTSGPSTKAVAADGATPAQVRAWAADNDVACPALGQIPGAVVDAYNAALPEAADG